MPTLHWHSLESEGLLRFWSPGASLSSSCSWPWPPEPGSHMQEEGRGSVPGSIASAVLSPAPPPRPREGHLGEELFLRKAGSPPALPTESFWGAPSQGFSQPPCCLLSSHPPEYRCCGSGTSFCPRAQPRAHTQTAQTGPTSSRSAPEAEMLILASFTARAPHAAASEGKQQ